MENKIDANKLNSIFRKEIIDLRDSSALKLFKLGVDKQKEGKINDSIEFYRLLL
jgi:hypothetical protein